MTFGTKINTWLEVLKRQQQRPFTINDLWRVILSLLIVGIVILLSAHVYIFYTVEHSDFSGGTLQANNKDTATLDQAHLKSALDFLDTRRTTFESIRNTSATIVDPSH